MKLFYILLSATDCIVRAGSELLAVAKLRALGVTSDVLGVVEMKDVVRDTIVIE